MCHFNIDGSNYVKHSVTACRPIVRRGYCLDGVILYKTYYHILKSY